MESKVINTEDIFTKLLSRKISFLGFATRRTKNETSCVYDYKEKNTFYFLYKDMPLIITQQKEYYDHKLIRFSYNSKFITSKNAIKLMKDTQIFHDHSLTYTETAFYVNRNYKTNNFFSIPLDNNVKREKFPNVPNEMKLYGTNDLIYVADDGFDNERYPGIFINYENMEIEATRNELYDILMENYKEALYNEKEI